jgi:hypothetical protein
MKINNKIPKASIERGTIISVEQGGRDELELEEIN